MSLVQTVLEKYGTRGGLTDKTGDEHADRQRHHRRKQKEEPVVAGADEVAGRRSGTSGVL